MPLYQSFDPNAEIVGTTVSGFTKSVLYEDLTGVLKRHNLDNIDPTQWYPVQNLLNVYNDMAVKGNTSSVFVSLGMAAVQVSLDHMPAAMKSLTLAQFLSNYDSVWQSRHRGGDVGYVRFEQVNDNHFVMTFKSPYPDDIFYGAFYAYARHFCPRNKRFSVSYDTNHPRRDRGGEETVIHIRLENPDRL
jgi:hypothetical protein